VRTMKKNAIAADRGLMMMRDSSGCRTRSEMTRLTESFVSSGARLAITR